MVDSVIRVNKKYFPQTHLEECKYEIKKNKMENFFNDDLSLNSSGESGSQFDNDSNNESDNESEKSGSD